MTTWFKLAVPADASYRLTVKVERRDRYYPKSWNPEGTFTIEPGKELNLSVSRDVRVSKIEQIPLDPATVLPADGHKSITINEDAHGG